MILQSLVRLSEQESLLAQRHYEPRPVAWIVDIDREGRLLGIVSNRQIPRGSSKTIPLTELIPRRRPGRTSTAIVPDDLVDNAKYCFGFALPTGKKGSRPDHLQKARESHRRHLAEVIAFTEDEGVRAQLACVQRIAEDPTDFSRKWRLQDENPVEVIDPESRRIRTPSAWKPNNLFAFRLNGEWVCHRPGIREYLEWKRQEQEGVRTTCLVCGQDRLAVRLHPTVPLPGPTIRGVPLVSFNQKAFESYHLTGNENAPICLTCADGYSTALKRLLHRRGFPDPHQAGATLPIGNVRLSSDTVVVFWSEENRQVAMPFLAGLLKARPEAVAALYSSPYKGQEIAIDDPTPFHILIFTGVQGRAVLRTAQTSTLGTAAQTFRQHFEDLRVCPGRWASHPRLSLPDLVEALRPPDRSASVSPHLITLLFTAALTGHPYPTELLAGVLRRIRVEAGDEKREGISARRIALVKAWLNRQHRFHPQPFPFKELTPGMDPANTTPAYLLGRLFAVLEKLQNEAINAGKGIADLFIGTASTTPALVFGRLLKMHHHHLAKLHEGRAIQFGQMIDNILSPLPGTIPSILSLTEQGVFMVGYHHQRAELYKKRDSNTKGGTNNHE